MAKKTKKISKKKTGSDKKIKAEKKTPRARQTVKSKLSSADIEYFKSLLLKKRKELFGDVDSISNEALKKSRLDAAGDLSSMPIHMADIGTDNYEQEFSLDLLDSERKLLVEIDRALQRIDQGQYGICEGTGKPIPKTRLEAKPWAKYCVEYARLIEKGLVKEEENSETQWEQQEEQEEFDAEQEQPEQDLDDERPDPFGIQDEDEDEE